jgi:sortase A
MKGLRRWTKVFFFVWGFSLLGYCGYLLINSWLFQKAEIHRFEHLLAEQRGATVLKKSVVREGGLLGRIEIPRLGVSVMVIEGSNAADLSQAAGHIAGTALPGEPGNVGISAHRDTFFRPLRNIRQNDIITVTTLAGKYQYRVVSTQVVSPYNLTVLASNSQQILTLVTCYPFYFVGSAPNRFIVRAERVT